MGVKRLGDVTPFDVGAQHQAADAGAVTKLGVLVGSRPAVGRPLFHVFRVNVIEPAAPVVPGDEDDSVGPDAPLYDGVHLLDGPLHARTYDGTRSDAMGRVFAEVLRIQPGDGGEITSGGVNGELLGPVVAAVARQAGDVLKNEVPAVRTPVEAAFIRRPGSEGRLKGGRN